MGALDPVSWEELIATGGEPAANVAPAIDRLEDEIQGLSPYETVKTVHDALSADLDEADRRVPGLGEVFVTAYVLEQRGHIHPGDEYRSVVDRRPDGDRLRRLFWERERTIWWIGILAGVHPSLVTYWLFEADIPLMERNLTDERLAAVRASRDAA